MEIKEYHLTWHYRYLLSLPLLIHSFSIPHTFIVCIASNTDNEYGKMQARDLQLHLEGNFGKKLVKGSFRTTNYGARSI